MKAVRFNAPRNVEVVEIPSAALTPGEVRVKIARIGICGSDMHRYQGHFSAGPWPVIPGHECAGTVVEVAPPAEALIGQRVAVMPMTSCGRCAACLGHRPNHCSEVKMLGPHRQGCYAEEVVVLPSMLRPLPESMSMDEGALVEPTAIAVHCANQGHVQRGDRVAILGAGCIGLLIQQVARVRGAQYVLATGRCDEKMSLARKVGVDETVNVNREEVVTAARANSFDVIFDTVGNQEAMDQAIALARSGGRIVTVAAPHGQSIQLNYAEFYRKELWMVASRLYDTDFDDAIPLIASGRVRPLSIVTHRFPLVQAPQALAEIATNRREVVKALLVP